MSKVVFRTTEKGFFVVFPFGKISPFGLTTSDEKKFNSAKSAYNTCFFIALGAMIYYYRWSYLNPDEKTKLVLFLLSASLLVGLYLVMIISLGSIDIYSKQKHGEINYSKEL